MNSVNLTNNMSFINLILNADFIVQFIIFLLFSASIYSWSIAFNKFVIFRKLNTLSKSFEKELYNQSSLEALFNSTNIFNIPLTKMFHVAMKEFFLIQKKFISNQQNLNELIEQIQVKIEIVKNKELHKLTSGTEFLATISSTAPFIGLFGTVWGIMNSFQSIAVSKNATLAVVAPGIAEALLATGIGLFVAIPALIFYNILSTKISNYKALMDSASYFIALEISKQLQNRINENLQK